MSTDRFMALAQEISDNLNIIPSATQFRVQIKKTEDKFKTTVKSIGEVYPTAEPGSSAMTVLMAALDNVAATLEEIQTDLNHATGELSTMVQASTEVIEALKVAAEQIQRDPDAVLSARKMYTDKQSLYRVGYINMWIKIVISLILIIAMYKNIGYIVIVYVCVVVVYFLILAFKYLFTKNPSSTALVGTPTVETETVPVNCADTLYGCCEWNGTVARVDRMGSNCPPKCPASTATTATTATTTTS
jgi:hypothetical protein